MKKIRCIKCGKLLLELEGKAEIICHRCKTKNKFDTRKGKAIAKENLEATPHTWTKGLDYEVIQEEDYFTIASNEGQLHYVNEVKKKVLDNFIIQ